MDNIEIKIWEVECGEVKSVKINNAVVPLIHPYNYDPFEKRTGKIDDPLEVAHAFVKLFDLKHARKANSFHKLELEEMSTEVSKKEDSVVINKTDTAVLHYLPSDLVHLTNSGLHITESKLRTLYDTLKSRHKFTVSDAKRDLKGVPGYSEPVIRECMKYLVNRGYATCVRGAIGNTKKYTFLVPSTRWRFGNKTTDAYKFTHVVQDNDPNTKITSQQRSVKVDFDPEELRNRRMLEMNTAREGV